MQHFTEDELYYYMLHELECTIEESEDAVDDFMDWVTDRRRELAKQNMKPPKSFKCTGLCWEINNVLFCKTCGKDGVNNLNTHEVQ